MEKNTKIIIVLAIILLAFYYLYNKKEHACVSNFVPGTNCSSHCHCKSGKCDEQTHKCL